MFCREKAVSRQLSPSAEHPSLNPSPSNGREMGLAAWFEDHGRQRRQRDFHRGRAAVAFCRQGLNAAAVAQVAAAVERRVAVEDFLDTSTPRARRSGSRCAAPA